MSSCQISSLVSAAITGFTECRSPFNKRTSISLHLLESSFYIHFIPSLLIIFSLTLLISLNYFLSKDWIGNERKRKGLASKRGPRQPNTLKYVPGQKRKKSVYSVFKSTFLSSEEGKRFVYSQILSF